MRTARETDAHSVLLVVGRYLARTVGWNSKPV